MKPEVRRKVARWSTWLALAVAVVAAAWFLTRPQRVVVEVEGGDAMARYLPGVPHWSDGIHPTSTFRTQNLLVDHQAQVGSITIDPLTVMLVGVSGDNVASDALISSISEDTNHTSPGPGIDNERINLLIRNNTTFDTTSVAGKSTGIDIDVEGHTSVGGLQTTNAAIYANASGGTSNYCFRSDLGEMRVDGSVNFNATSSVDLGSHVQNFRVPGSTSIVPEIDLGYTGGVDGANIHIKNVTNGNINPGIEVGGDTSVTGATNVAPQIVMYRGAGGGFGTSNFSLICVDNGAGSCLDAAAVGDFVIADYAAAHNTFIAQKTGFVAVGRMSAGNAFTATATFTAAGNVGIGSATAPAYTANASNWITSGIAGTTTDQLTIDSESIVANTSDLNSITIHNSGTFDTTASSKNAIGLRIVVDPTESAGGNLLNNVGLTIDTNNGDTNTAIHVIHGTTQIDELLNAANAVFSSTVHVVGDFDVNTSKFTVQASSGNVEAIGLVTLSNTTESLWTEGRTYLGGNVKGDTVYVSGGSINFGYEQNATDHLFLNFTGYHGAFTQARDLRISDGMGDQIWTVEGGTGHIVQTGEGHTAPSGGAGCTAGGGGSITGTDNNFRLITGGTSTACTVSFGASWGTAPVCTIYPSAGTTLPTCTISATAITCTVNLASTTYNVQCEGVPGSV